MKTAATIISNLLIPALAFAAPYQACKPYSFLKKGFNLEAIAHCQYHLKNCPKTGPVLDRNCVQMIVKKDPTCTQVGKLATVLNSDINNIMFEKINNFILVDQVFPADGQHNYYLITPKNCLLNTKIDPRQLNPQLRKQHKNTLFIIMNAEKPIYVQNKDAKSSSFTASLKVTKNCVACELIGWGKVRYDFNQEGKLVNMKLINFSDQK